MALTEAAVGAIIGELLKSLLAIKGKIEEYNLMLNRIEATLRKIEPIVQQIDNLKLSQQGEQTKLLWEEIKKGKELLQCCKKEIGGCCSCLQKQQYQYLGRLQELDNSLSSFYNIVSLHTLREVIQTREVMEDLLVLVREGHAQRDNQHKQVLEEIEKLRGKDTNNNSLADKGNKNPSPQAMQSGYASGEETRFTSSSAPVKVPVRSVTPVSDYGRINSKGKDGGGASDYAPFLVSKGKENPSFNGSLPTGKIPAAPKEYAPLSPVPRTSGFSQIRSNLEEDRHRDQTKRSTTTAHSVPPSRPSPPPKSPEIIRETRRNAPAQIIPHQAMDPPWQQPHVQPEPEQVKQIPDKAKEVHREPAYSYSPDNKTKISISPVSLNDFKRGASFGKDSPSGRYSSYPNKPAGPATANYGFGIPPKSPETKAVGPTTTTTNLTSSRPYIPPDPPSSRNDNNPKSQLTDRSHSFAPYHQSASAAPPKPQEIKTNFVKDPSGYSSPMEKRSTGPTIATRSKAIPQSSQPKTKEVDHNQGNVVPDRWRTAGQPISGSSYTPPANKALPTKIVEIKKGAGEEEWSSDDNE